MYSNDLNSAYTYESERRNDERRAATDSQWLRGLDDKHKLGLPTWVTIVGMLVALLVVIRAF